LQAVEKLAVAAPGVFVQTVQKFRTLGGCGTPNTLTKLLDLHAYHKCNRSTLRGPDLDRPPPPLKT